MMQISEAQLFADLAALNIDYVLTEHEAVFTVEESDALDRQISGAHTKNLFLKDFDGDYFLVTVPAHIRVDLKLLPVAIGSKRVSFGKADDMLRLLGIAPGSVTPLAAINDSADEVRVVIDAKLMTSDKINVHPLRNTATLTLAPVHLRYLLSHWQHEPQIADIPRLLNSPQAK
jgi:Ala-tRNA(Pro) deacylase